MDEILEKFENTLGTARVDELPSHQDLYKNWGKYGNQEERRTEILRQQKSNRENKLDNVRGILKLMDCTEEKRSLFRKAYRARYQPNVYVPGFTNSTNSYYNNVLMLSEWMVEKPEDFSTNWLVAPCPKGTRVLVVACHGVTRFYTKYGQLCLTTSSILPGGHHNEKWKNCAVLDGFFCKDTNTLHILDVLSWKNHIMADGEMEFRRYWLETKFNEYPMEKITKSNRVSLKLLPMIPCDNDSLQEFMMTHPPLTSAKLDGLLFYHKRGHYVAGETPLVGWLYPYMVPEVLCPDMQIHELYAAQKPENYVNQATFIQIFEEKYSKKKKPFNRGKKNTHRTSETSMDAEEVSVVQNEAVQDDITEQNNDNATEQNNDTATDMTVTATMETENAISAAENVRKRVEQAVIAEVGEKADIVQVLFQSYRDPDDQDSNPQPATITKYYSYF